MNLRGGVTRYLRNASWMFLDKALALFASVFVGIWLARFLGPESYGVFSYVNSFVALFSVIAVLGIDAVLVRELVQPKFSEGELLGTALILRTIGGVMALSLLALIQLMQSNPDVVFWYAIIAGSALIFNSSSVVELYYQARVQSKYSVITNSLCITISCSLKVLLILKQAPLSYFIWMLFLDGLLLGIAYLLLYNLLSGSIIHWSFRWNAAKMFLRSGLPLVLGGVVVAVYMKIDQVMLAQMVDMTSVGHYSVAVRLSEFWYIIPTTLSAAFFPALLESEQVDSVKYTQRFQMLCDVMFWMSACVVFFVIVFGGDLIGLLFGSVYEPAGPVLKIHVVAGLFAVLGIVSANWFIQAGLESLLFWRSLVGAVLNIVLNLILIPHFEIMGAAVATVAAQFLSGYVFNAFNKKCHALFVMQTKAITAPIRYLKNW